MPLKLCFASLFRVGRFYFAKQTWKLVITSALNRAAFLRAGYLSAIDARENLLVIVTRAVIQLGRCVLLESDLNSPEPTVAIWIGSVITQDVVTRNGVLLPAGVSSSF